MSIQQRPHASAFGSPADTSADPAPPPTGYVGFVGVLPVAAPFAMTGSPVETVGAGKQFATIAAAIDAAQDGATILVDAGTYVNDFATITRKLTLIGVGGVVNMVATVPPANLKGILTVDASATIQNFAFSGAAVSDADGGNGAGIRYEGGDLVLRNDGFTHNQDGLLAFPALGLASNTIVLDHDTFDQNGSGSGYTHNVYVGGVDSLTVTDSVFERAVVGHELKSRALVNTIANNSFYDGPTGTASYDIDLPNGGKDVVQNNTIEKGPNAQNNAIVHFAGEGIPYSGSSLLVQGNAFVNDKGSSVIGVLNQSAIGVTITGNSFANMTASQIASGPATEAGNYDGAGNRFADGSLTGVLPGATQIFTDSAPHTVVLNSSTSVAVQGGAGLLTVTAISGHVVVIGGSGGLNYTEVAPSGGNSITTSAGSANTILLSGQDTLDSEGADAIAVGAGNVTAQVNGAAAIRDGAGSNQWSVGGTATISSKDSNEFISVGAAGHVSVAGTNAYLQIQGNGGTASFDVTVGGAREAASLNGGSYLMRTYGGAINVTTGGGAQGVAITLTAGDANVTSVGADVVRAGSGSDSVIVSGAAQVYAGTGQLSVFGRGDTAGAKVYGAGGDVILDGDTGNITYYGGALANTVESRLSSDVFVGGAGRLTINGGSRETIQGGAGGLTFNSNGGGANTVSTAAGATDTLRLSGSDAISSLGADTITTTGSLTGTVRGNSSVTAGNQDVSLTLSGTDQFTGTGHDVLQITKGAVATVTVAGFTDAYEVGATVRYSDVGGGDAASATVTGGAASIHSEPGRGITVATAAGAPTTVVLGAGAATVGSASNDAIHAGSGADTIFATGKGASIWGGSGTTAIHDDDWTSGDAITVHGGSGALTYDQGPGALTFIGGSGAAVIDGGYGSLAIRGGSGALTVSGGSRGLRFAGGAGKASIALTPGGGSVQFGAGATTVAEAGYGAADLYTFVQGHAAASDLIAGFRPGTDKLILSGVSVSSESVFGGSASIGFSDGSHVTLAGVSSLDNLFAPQPGLAHRV